MSRFLGRAQSGLPILWCLDDSASEQRLRCMLRHCLRSTTARSQSGLQDNMFDYVVIAPGMASCAAQCRWCPKRGLVMVGCRAIWRSRGTGPTTWPPTCNASLQWDLSLQRTGAVPRHPRRVELIQGDGLPVLTHGQSHFVSQVLCHQWLTPTMDASGRSGLRAPQGSTAP